MKLETQYIETAPCTLIHSLHQKTSLSKTALKKALAYGGVWVKAKPDKKKLRCRRATRQIQPGDSISLHFDDNLYQQDAPDAHPVKQTLHWGIWFKPANVLAQGSPFGDVGSMEYQVAKQRQNKPAFLLHRLDREVAGLMLFPYSREAAKRLQSIWNTTAMEKYYTATLLGIPDQANGVIQIPLDGKPCETHYRVIDTLDHNAVVEIRLGSGRFHQIRRHFDLLGHPVLGDPRYGKENKNQSGLKLIAHRLLFTCPFTQEVVDCRLPLNEPPLEQFSKLF